MDYRKDGWLRMPSVRKIVWLLPRLMTLCKASRDWMLLGRSLNECQFMSV